MSDAPASRGLRATAVSHDYTRGERIADAAVHFTGIALALMAAPVLILLAAVFDGGAPVVAGVAVYTVGMFAMLGCSAAYNLIPTVRWKELLRRLDHAAIYVKIAATQTPFAMLIGGAGMGWVIGSVWATALGAVLGKLFWPARMRRLSLPLYLGLGWAGLMLMWPGEGAHALSPVSTGLIVTGGLIYTAGVGFFLAKRLRFHNAIWHGFVLVATFVFYSAIISEIGLRAVAAAG
ncbi:hemolysin III [Albimonas donghaensis]|uniref:Hemolysin III n=1 Tax=Albimonas donghaensis TaxID=356660 RepID=A0A1H3CYU1_9RHOB|nr:hemolysin III family protein [Albimonas donghaensis]SDX59295.1 hemolysin III [Albimonas donghaensis]